MGSSEFKIYVLGRAYWEEKGIVSNSLDVPDYSIAIEFPEKISVSATLHRLNGDASMPVGDKSIAVALLLDLLRDGWQELCQRVEQPMVKGDTFLRGFVLKRSSRLTPDVDWRLSVLVGCDLEADFTWKDAINLLDTFRSKLLSAVR